MAMVGAGYPTNALCQADADIEDQRWQKEDRNNGGMRGTRDRVPRCTRILLPLDISKGPEQVEPAIPSASLARMSPRARQ